MKVTRGRYAAGVDDPASLDDLLRFLNSHHDGDVADWFATPELAARRLRDLGVPVRTVTRSETELLRSVRDALNALLPGGYVSAPRNVEQVLAGLSLRAGPGGDGVALSPRHAGVRGYLERMVAAAQAATVTGAWGRLRTCKNQATCCWVFEDRSKNRSRVWCDMATCGTSAKARAFRERRRAARRAAAPR